MPNAQLVDKRAGRFLPRAAMALHLVLFLAVIGLGFWGLLEAAIFIGTAIFTPDHVMVVIGGVPNFLGKVIFIIGALAIFAYIIGALASCMTALVEAMDKRINGWIVKANGAFMASEADALGAAAEQRAAAEHF